jgi:hypothetical protein
MTDADITRLLAVADLADRTDRLMLADAMEECGRSEETGFLQDTTLPVHVHDGRIIDSMAMVQAAFDRAEVPTLEIASNPLRAASVRRYSRSAIEQGRLAVAYFREGLYVPAREAAKRARDDGCHIWSGLWDCFQQTVDRLASWSHRCED